MTPNWSFFMMLMEWFIGVDPYDIEPTWLLEFRMFNA
jgi:hypothetical protein